MYSKIHHMLRDVNKISVKETITDSVKNLSTSHLTEVQGDLLDKLMSYPLGRNSEQFYFNDNTPYATVYLHQGDFNRGTVRITRPGYYVLLEDITFHPNPENNFEPTDEQISSGLYPKPGPYNLNFFAAVTIECSNVILD